MESLPPAWQAGIVILQEAGGAAFGAKGTDMSGRVGAELLQGRKYFFIRGLPDGPVGPRLRVSHWQLTM